MGLYVVERDVSTVTPERLRHVHASDTVAYSRVVEIVDLTPSFLNRDTSRSRRSLRWAVGPRTDGGSTTRTSHTMTANSASELSQWLADGQRLFGVCLSMVEGFERLEARARTLESENEILREEVGRLRDKADGLQAEPAHAGVRWLLPREDGIVRVQDGKVAARLILENPQLSVEIFFKRGVAIEVIGRDI